MFFMLLIHISNFVSIRYFLLYDLWGMQNRRGGTIEQNGPKGQYVPTICQDRSESIWIRLYEKSRRVVRPRSLKDKYSSKDQRMTIKSIMTGAGEGRRDMQVKKGGNFQVKYPSPLYSMHCTNSIGHINGRMTLTLEQCPHSLQHILSPLVRP